jgi:hypothetical protein
VAEKPELVGGLNPRFLLVEERPKNNGHYELLMLRYIKKN